MDSNYSVFDVNNFFKDVKICSEIVTITNDFSRNKTLEESAEEVVQNYLSINKNYSKFMNQVVGAEI